MSKLNRVTKAFGVSLLWAMAAIALPAQTFTTLVNFNSADGANPFAAGLVQGTDGNLYGVTGGGGANDTCVGGCGTVFKITPSGTLTTLYSFDGGDGASPVGLAQGADGAFYGTTSSGGALNNECNGTTCGTVFRITPSGTLTTLHSFDGTDGNEPLAGLVLGTDGNFYGTTYIGGLGGCEGGCGTVFKITPGGTLTSLYSFRKGDGYSPFTGLVQGTDGDLYGTTLYGGTSDNCRHFTGCGTVFRITPGGTLMKLYTFCSQSNCMDGQFPEGELIQGADGNVYGTTTGGGANDTCMDGCGTVFKITPSGTLTTLHSFDGTDGAVPLAAGLVLGTDGNYYGTTFDGGAGDCEEGCGTVFKLTPSGTLTTLHSFNVNGEDGSQPAAALFQGTDGYFYGTTDLGGTGNACQSGCGTIFSLSVGLKPFVETQPTAGAVGAAVNIPGTNLTGATSVTFNGTSAVFTVISKTLITTSVPTGATTGTVEVIRPNGKGLSNVPFTVLP
jgi:uncharacterized repeat protein (TIGR03803 family)